jgi:hypothetical protein
MPRRCDDDDANEKTRAARAAARFERRDPTQRADGVSKRQNQKRRKRSPDDVQLPTSPGGGGRAGAGSGAGRRAGVSTRRSEHAPGSEHAPDGAMKRKTPAARPRGRRKRSVLLGPGLASRCISVHLGASWSGLGIMAGRDMSVVALSRDSPASRAPSPSHPTFATLSRPLPSRVRSLVEDLLGWPSQCHLHPFAVRSLPRVLYHTRGGGGSCAISTTPAGVGAPESPARA